MSRRSELAPPGPLIRTLPRSITEVRGKRLSKVELYEKIRLVRRDESLSVRALAARFKVHRREVRAALASPEPAPRKTPVRASPVTGEWHGWIREVLLADRDAPRKQRHTAKRIRDRLAAEHGVLISESQCRVVVAHVRARRSLPRSASRRRCSFPRPGFPARRVRWIGASSKRRSAGSR